MACGTLGGLVLPVVKQPTQENIVCLLYFQAKLTELRLSAHEFLETAYVWRFGKQGHVTPDFCEYLNHGILPIYCIQYLKHLQEKESSQGVLF